MNQSIQNGIGNGWIPDVFVPVFDGQLSAHDGGSQAVAIFDDLQEIASFLSARGGQAQVIDVPSAMNPCIF